MKKEATTNINETIKTLIQNKKTEDLIKLLKTNKQNINFVETLKLAAKTGESTLVKHLIIEHNVNHSIAAEHGNEQIKQWCEFYSRDRNKTQTKPTTNKKFKFYKPKNNTHKPKQIIPA
jgi:pyocin large subunit-like protein